MAQQTGWPSPSEYSTALQNPQNRFPDAVLRTGAVSVNQLGLPIGASGNFAVVYRLRCGSRDFAVRCFIRPVTDLDDRYQEVGQYLGQRTHPSLVDFAYLTQGIRVRGQLYPVVRMEWVAGKQLSAYVEANVRQPAALKQLTEQWRTIVAELRAIQAAHGDLQHGNILVDGNGAIKLVDYDGLYIPALRDRPPSELGHPNYQHPERLLRGYYGEGMDAFAANVIYLSLLAVAASPDLWAFHSGENLIFSADDYTNPGATAIWKHLMGVADDTVRQLTVSLQAACQGSVSAVPALDDAIAALAHAPVPPIGARPSSASVGARVAQRVSYVPMVASATIVTCPNCGMDNVEDEIYCQNCARQLCGVKRCSCNQYAIPAKASFCTFCGKAA